MELTIGPESIGNYRRLSYTPWHAIAEFIDNSTQAYFNNRQELDAVFQQTGECLEVNITYNREQGILRIADTSIGMSYDDLDHAMHVAKPPMNATGRSRFGMGLKTAACWLGDQWVVSTKKLGETVEHRVTIDVDRIASGTGNLLYEAIENRPATSHFTIVEINRMNRTFKGRTLGKIRQYLTSMYREDFRNGILKLTWDGDVLEWKDIDDQILKSASGQPYKMPFAFETSGKPVHGWVAILEPAGRAKAGFSIIHSGRVIMCPPEAWRPTAIFGIDAPNDLVNQRLVGEIHLDEFGVSQAKDNILWRGDQEYEVEKMLAEACTDYIATAKARRHGDGHGVGPTQMETDVAVSELKKELLSPEMVDALEVELIPSQELVESQTHSLTESVSQMEPTFIASVGNLTVKGLLLNSLSPADPYVAHDSTQPNEVLIVVNLRHPHWTQLRGMEGVLNYLRHCVYDGIAEWQAKHKAASLTPDMIKCLKDRLLRLPMEIEMTR